MRLRLVPAVACLSAALLLSASSAFAQGAEPRVVGGEETSIHDWPWQVAIAHPPSEGGDGYDRQFCGGSLVAPTVVLTAAHCAYDGAFQPPSDFSVISGRTTLSSDEGAEMPAADVLYFVDRGSGPVAQSSTQPRNGTQLYDDSTSEWDVVLIVLPAAAPAPAAPIQIASAAERGLWEDGDPAFITGWGDTTGAQTYADDLHQAEVEIIGDTTCENAYPPDWVFVETMVCAGNYPLGGEDSCQGDSGGPLVAPVGDGTYRLVGDTSWGIGCALPTLPGVYGRVADEPMRSALEAAVAQAAGGYDVTGPPATGAGAPSGSGAPGGGDGGPGSGAVDDKAPRTTFESGPAKRTRKRRAALRFSADEAGSTFECSLDGRAYEPCSSPHSVRVRRGRHVLVARATDAAGNVEPSPPRYVWKVLRKRRH